MDKVARVFGRAGLRFALPTVLIMFALTLAYSPS